MPKLLPFCACGCKRRVTQARYRYFSHECSTRVHRTAKPATKVEERIRIEDRLVVEMQKYLVRHPFKPQLRPVRHKGTKASPHEMVLLFSDTHYPEVVDPQAAMGLKYNGTICRHRIERIRDVTIRYKDLRSGAYPVQKLTIAGLGDFLSGDIHEELSITNEAPISEALVKLAYIIYDMGIAFAQEFPEVEFIFMPGNHPRLKKVPYFKQKYSNWDYVLGHMVAALARGTRIKVQVPKDLVYVHQVLGWRVGMTHGDGIMSASWGGIPWYGLKQRRDAMQALLNHLGQPRLDYLLMGHFHTPMTWAGTDCDIIINGAVKGGDEFSLGTRYAANDPVQLLLTFHHKRGLADTSRINLKDVV